MTVTFTGRILDWLGRPLGDRGDVALCCAACGLAVVFAGISIAAHVMAGGR